MESTTRSNPSCLLVEDEALIGVDIEEQVSAAGYDVQWAGSLQGALTYLEAGTPDVAIIDVVLRDGQGTDLVHELKQRGVPFVIHSGWASQPDIPELRDVPWLTKPADIALLLSALESSRRRAPTPD